MLIYWFRSGHTFVISSFGRRTDSVGQVSLAVKISPACNYMKHKHLDKKDKPLVEMTKTELNETFYEMGSDVDEAMLNDARNYVDQETMIAVVILKRAGCLDAKVYSVEEYGDREGVSQVDEFIAGVEHNKLLLPGESLEREVRLVTATTKIDYDAVAQAHRAVVS